MDLISSDRIENDFKDKGSQQRGLFYYPWFVTTLWRSESKAMLKFELDSLEGLDEAHKSFYEEKDGKYTLKVDGLPQPNSEELEGLRKNRDELLAEKKAEQQKRKEAEEKARKDAEENAKKTGDI